VTIAAPRPAPALAGIAVAPRRPWSSAVAAGTRHRAHTGALALGGYALVTLALMAPVLASPATRYLGSIPDAMQSIWFLSWTAHALQHGHFLLFTDALNAPAGVNLMWNTPMTLLGVVGAPITLTAGPVVAYNALMAAAFCGSAWVAYRAVARFCDRRAASWAGGLLFALSPYMLAQSLGHLDLVAMVFPPLALLLGDEILRRHRWRWWVAGGWLGVAAAAQVLVMEEVLATVAIGAAVALLAGGRPLLRRLGEPYAVRALGTAAVTFAVLAAGPLAYQLAGPQVPPGLSEVASATGTDLAAFVAPTANQAVAPPPGTGLAGQLNTQSTGQDGYVGAPMLLLLTLTVWQFRRDRTVRAVALSGALLALLSLGPQLTVAGHLLPVPLPWRAVQHVPLLSNLVPLRLMVLADLCVALLVAHALAHATSRRPAVLALAAAAAITWLPALPRPSTSTPPPLPAALSRSIPSGSTVQFTPPASLADTDAMWYQLSEGFRFRLAGGYAYVAEPATPPAGSTVVVRSPTR